MTAPATSVPGLTLEQPDRTQWAQPPTEIKAFELTNEEGKPVKSSDLRGRTALVFFGFTNCPNICPPTMQLIRQAQLALQQEKMAVDGVLISVDGERDTPAAMKAFLEPFGPDFRGMTGDPRLVRDIAAGFKAIFFKGMPTDSAGGYNVEHTSQVYLVDRQGRLRATFYNAPVSDVVAVTRSVVGEKD